MKVFISTTTFAEYNKEPLEILKKRHIDYALNPYKRRLNEDEICDILANDSYIGLIAGTEPLTKEVLLKAKGLKVISRAGTGLDNIDLETAKKLHIRVYNTPKVLTDSVAELTMGLILNSLRRITLMDKDMRKKEWKKELGSLFKDKVLGIIGLGKIGRRVARLAKAFGADVIFYDIKSIRHRDFRQVSLNRLLRLSDIISIHSLEDKIIKKKDIAKIKQEAILINTSRGSAIDENGLYKALRSKRIAFAALDVYNREPYFGKLLGLDNIILTPHIGSYAKESRIEMEKEAVENLIKGFKEGGLL